MKKSSSIAVFCLALFLCLWPALAAAQGRITQAVLGRGVTDKFEIVNAASEFNPDTPKIYCAWKTDGVKAGTRVRGVWIAEDVGTAAPKNFKIDETTFNPPVGSPTAGSFALSKPNKGFPVGKYRLEIYLNNNLVKTVPFTVQAK